jgi:hypothetical protein
MTTEHTIHYHGYTGFVEGCGYELRLIHRIPASQGGCFANQAEEHVGFFPTWDEMHDEMERLNRPLFAEQKAAREAR